VADGRVQETKIKGYINITGYKVITDENIDPGKYGFRLVHDTDKAHLFSSEELSIVRDWVNAIMKATITRDYKSARAPRMPARRLAHARAEAVISSVNIPTIPLVVAQTMNPAPRPPSPGARDAAQRATRRENPNQLSTRDAKILMGIPGADGAPLPTEPLPAPPAAQDRRLPSAFREQPPAAQAYAPLPPPAQQGGYAQPQQGAYTQDGYAQGQPPMSAGAGPTSPRSAVPPRPSREARRASSTASTVRVPLRSSARRAHMPADV
jgi:hypothetical protein